MTSICIVTLLLSISGTDAAFTDAKYVSQQAKPILTVLVRDTVNTNPAIRKLAKAEAIRILDRAGIELRWTDLNGSEDPRLPTLTKGYVTVVIARFPPIGTEPDALGTAPARTGPYLRAYVFAGLINGFLRRFASPDQSAFAIVLGHAVAHELGHLVMTGEAHGDGIMRPLWAYREWKEAQQGTLLFAPSDARRLREALQSRRDHLFQ